jgi:transposase-like protein
MKCLKCQSDNTIKDGHHRSGSEKYNCKACSCNFTPCPKPKGYDAAKKQTAIEMYIDGINYRRVARLLKISHQSISNRVTQVANQIKIEEASFPAAVPDTIVELDELFTFSGSKKRN